MADLSDWEPVKPAAAASAPSTDWEPVAAPAQAPAAPAAPSDMGVVQNAAYGAVAGLGDSVLNAPTNVMNLGKMAFGTGATALGRPDLAPEPSKPPDIVSKLFDKLGLTKSDISPQGWQKLTDVLVRGGVGGALTGGSSIMKALTGAGMGALSSGAAQGTQALASKAGASDSLSTALGNTAGLLAPKGAVGGVTAARAATERNASIPPERVEAYKAMADKGARPQGSALVYGEANKNVAGQQRVANETYNESVGLPKKQDFGSADVLKAHENLSKDYESMLKDRQVTLDKPLIDRIEAMYNEQSDLSKAGSMFAEARPIIDTLKKTMGAAGTSMDALQYNKLRSILGNDAQRAKMDPPRAKLLRQTQQALDEAADRSMPDIATKLSETRGKYENLMILSDAMVGKGAGHITPAEVGGIVAERMGHRSLEPSQHPLKKLGQQGLSLSGDKAIGDTNTSGVAAHVPKTGVSLTAIKRAIETPVTALRARGMANDKFYTKAKAAETAAKENARRAIIPMAATKKDNEP